MSDSSVDLEIIEYQRQPQYFVDGHNVDKEVFDLVVKYKEALEKILFIRGRIGEGFYDIDSIEDTAKDALK